MRKIAHIVNPLVVKNPRSDLYAAQPITLHTMAEAREQANAKHDLEVKHYAAFYSEDESVVPILDYLNQRAPPSVPPQRAPPARTHNDLFSASTRLHLPRDG
jgi:hypothetical protein